MGVKKSGRRARSRQVEDFSNVSTFSGSVRISRDFLLAGASLVALGALAAPDRTHAACSGPNQTISTQTTGPILGNGGVITVTATGNVTRSGGVTGSDGVDVTGCPARTLANSGTITGGAGSARKGEAAGGAGVSNSGTIGSLNNSGTISGGGAGSVSGNATGGAGVSNSGAITKLTNRGAISGGDSSSIRGAATPGDAIYSAGAKASIGTIANSGSIVGKVVIDK